MFVATAIVSILFAAVVAASAIGKLAKSPKVLDIMTSVGVPADKLWLLAGAELAGAAGLVVGLAWWPIGVAAAVGLVLYFVGAVAAHLRVGDRHIESSGVMLVAAIAALVLRVASI